MRSVALAIDITDVMGSTESLTTAATLFLPDTVEPEPVVVVAFPGAGYNRVYFDLRPPGYEGYSQAEHHTAAGLVFVACDHLGVGESTIPADPLAFHFEDMAAANAAAVSGVLERLAAGVAPGIDPIRPRTRLGIGQSAGGCLLTVQQGLHRTFDGVGLLGWTNVHLSFPDPTTGERRFRVGVPRDADYHLHEMVPPNPPEVTRHCYHHADDAPQLVDADMDPSRHPPWRSVTVPACTRSMQTAGVVAGEAARIDVPVLVVAGEREVMADPRAEAVAYPAAPEVTVVEVPRMGHMHNFAATRGQLWDRLVLWYQTVDALHTGDTPRLVE
jgi:alpha-beta hydrolase superfamily lysophospholipase